MLRKRFAPESYLPPLVPDVNYLIATLLTPILAILSVARFLQAKAKDEKRKLFPFALTDKGPGAKLPPGMR
jgi:hypothetical protein